MEQNTAGLILEALENEFGFTATHSIKDILDDAKLEEPNRNFQTVLE